jgi:hypothetical protein
MSDYFTRLAARALGTTEVARPRRSIFEPRRDAPGPLALEPEGVRGRDEAPGESPGESPMRAAEPAPPRTQAVQVPRRRQGETPAPPAEGTRLPAIASRRASERSRPRPQPVPAPEAAAPRPAARMPRVPERPAELEAARPDAADRRPSARVLAHERAEPPPLPPPLLAARPPPRPALPVKQASSPTVRVTIGRVDVRAVAAERQPKPRRKERPAPRISLDEYLGRARKDAG